MRTEVKSQKPRASSQGARSWLGKVAAREHVSPALLEKHITDGRSTSGPPQPNDVEVKRYPTKPTTAPKKTAKTIQ